MIIPFMQYRKEDKEKKIKKDAAFLNNAKNQTRNNKIRNRGKKKIHKEEDPDVQSKTLAHSQTGARPRQPDKPKSRDTDAGPKTPGAGPRDSAKDE
ncbi:hypothetical protein DMENIID0001_035310 [Sergentomyia squamirostris]